MKLLNEIEKKNFFIFKEFFKMYNLIDTNVNSNINNEIRMH